MRFARTVLLLAVGFSIIAPSNSQAFTEKQLSQMWNNALACSASCGQGLSQCVGGCGLFFHRRCVNDCNGDYNTCYDGCWADTPFVETSSAFDNTATLVGNGRTIRISGPLTCPEGAKATIDVTLTQEGGAVATGRVKVQCQADTAEFAADLKKTGRNEILPFGAAQACGVAQISRQSENATALQWCREVTVLPEGVQLED
jgi:hypothetical protein